MKSNRSAHIIGLCGKKQSGKNTFARLAKTYALRVGEVALADSLKTFCIDYLGLKHENCFGTDADKNQIITSWGSMFAPHILKEFNKQPQDPLTAREILQVVGTEIFRRNFWEDIWIDILMRKVRAMQDNYDFIFITDVRFPNEVEKLKAAGVKIVRLFRDTGCTDSLPHASELAMDTIPIEQFDYIVTKEQNVNPETLQPRVREILLAEHKGV